MISRALAFDDVLLEPKQCQVYHRSEVNLDAQLLGLNFPLPIISANMSTVTEVAMAKAMDTMCGFGILHRMNSIQDQCSMVKELRQNVSIVAASIESNSLGIERAKALVENGCDVLCIDVAHAHSHYTLDCVKKILKILPFAPLIIGNIATVEAADFFWNEIKDLRNFDNQIAFKVGIGSGSQCTTRIVTGCGLPTLESLLRFQTRPNRPYGLIADGGMKNSGDIVKALAAGADMVMLGSLLAGTKQSPGSVIKHHGNLYKVYRGSASYGQKFEIGKETKYVEGEETLIPYKGDVEDILDQLKEGIASGISYVGGKDLKTLRQNATFVEISNNGFKESTAHGSY